MNYRGIMDFIELLKDHAAGMLYEALSKKHSTSARDLIKRLEQFHEGEAKAHAFFEGLELEIRNSKKRLDNRLNGLKKGSVVLFEKRDGLFCKGKVEGIYTLQGEKKISISIKGEETYIPTLTTVNESQIVGVLVPEAIQTSLDRSLELSRLKKDMEEFYNRNKSIWQEVFGDKPIFSLEDCLKIDEEERKINEPLSSYTIGDYVYNKSGYLLGKVVKKLPKSLIVRKEVKLEDLIS